jgi:hypothetical protein
MITKAGTGKKVNYAASTASAADVIVYSTKDAPAEDLTPLGVLLEGPSLSLTVSSPC